MSQLNNTSIQAQFDNFFELFDLPVQFDIDNDALDSRMRTLQQQYHPDNLDTAQQGAEAISQNTSALINHAYQVLKFPDSRASYLLEMRGQDAELNNSISDLDFLEDAMSLRIELDDADNMKELASLVDSVQARLITYMHQFKTVYEQQQWPSAIDATQKLKFLVKLKKDIEAKMDSLLQVIDDDDLYV